MCGYRMKPTDKRKTESEDSWICIWKKCGWETYQTLNGKLHWLKKSAKQCRFYLTCMGFYPYIIVDMRFEKKINKKGKITNE